MLRMPRASSRRKMLLMIERSARRSRATALLTILLCLVPIVALGQQPLVVDDNYHLQAGDVVVVQILGEEKLGGTLQVGPGGSIALPAVGSVYIAGKTLREARDVIARNYQDIIRRPYVSVALDENASKRRVSVGGFVEKRGTQMLPFGAMLSDAVVAAGIIDESDLSHVTLQRLSGEVSIADLSGLRTGQPLGTNVVLQWDDYIIVPEFETRVAVVGQVAKPGTYKIPQGRRLNLLEVITQLSGGLTPEASRTALLIRPGAEKPVEVDLTRLLEQGDMSQNYELQVGDTVVVPESGRITIAGEVNQPTTLYPSRNLTLLEALVRAGGFTPNAGLREVQIRRGEQICTVNVEEMWRRGNTAENVLLLPGDVVIVPKAGPEEVLVMGAVVKAGTIDIREDEQPTLLKLLAAAGKGQSADYTRVSIYRAGEHIVANAQRALEQGDMRHNPTLQPGDVVFVPEAGKVALLGAFARPGLIDYDPKFTFLQYLTLGGLPPTGTARLGRGVVIRTRPDGTYETVFFDAANITKGKIPEPLKIQPGDVIYLEPKGAKRDLWSQIRDLLFTIGGLRALIP